MTTTPIRLVIADDHALVRQGIRAFLGTCPDLTIVGEAEDAASAVACCARERPDVALVDLVMLGGGIAATRQIRAVSPETQIVLITSFEDAAQILAGLEAGALSCLLKDIDADALAAAIRSTARGEAVLHPRVAGFVLDALRRNDGPARAHAQLSQREQEVLALIAEGLSNQDIGARLAISERTVKTHVSHILGKLDLTDRTQAAVYAWKTGIKQRGVVRGAS
jgi:NarL family two-component system response regulator LiaR